MKRKLFLHRINAPMDTDHVVYRLWVGESVREQRMLTQIIAWAFKTGATVRSWSEDIDFYLQIESDRVFPGRGLIDFGFISADVSAADVISLISTNSWESYEHSLSIPRSQTQILTLLDPSRCNMAEGRIVSHSVLAEKRKNLSHSQDGKRYLIRFK